MSTFPVNTISLVPKKAFRLAIVPEWCTPKRNMHVQYCCQTNWKNPGKTSSVKPMVPSRVAETTRHGGIGLSNSLTETTTNGIGIVDFLQGKVFFVTGATGFLAKVLVEKILRSAPNISKIYLMIKAKNKETAMQRLKTEIIDAELFKNLKQKYGDSYENFMLSKLIPVVGNVCEADIGLEEYVAGIIAKEVDVIINSAANTTFDERYDVSIKTNTMGPSHLMSFARKCNNLKIFLLVSTAYVNGQRKGIIMENPFSMGDCIAQENFNFECKQSSSLPNLDVKTEICLALNSKQALEDNSSVHHNMKKLGLERAQEHGWQNTYVFTKAMGEMMINHTRGEVPVVIIRPSIVEGTYKDPLPGWIEGIRMVDPIILHYGKGRLSALPANPNGVLDIVPADMVVNAILAATAKHGTARNANADIHVYQVASSIINPLTSQDLFGMFFEHFKCSPFMDSEGRPINIPRMEIYPSMQEFTTHLYKDMARQGENVVTDSSDPKLQQKLKVSAKRMTKQLINSVTMYEPFLFYHGRFDCSNTQKLMESMSEEEKMSFVFDVKSIDWKDYIINVHIPGLRKHAIKEK